MANNKTSYNQDEYNILLGSSIPKSIANLEGMRFDSVEDAALFFARELDYIKAQSYDRLYPELTATTLFPISHEINPGAETVTYYGYDKTGIAKIINDYATDLPRADVKGKPTTAFIKSVGASYGYSVQEMRASRMASKGLDVRKAEAARYAIEYELNRIAWAGDKAHGLRGVLSDDNDIPVFTPATVREDKTAWTDKTAEEILADLTNMQKQVAKTTRNVERPDTLVLPADVYIELSTRQIPNTGYTVLKFLLENAPYIKNVVSAAELQADEKETNPYAAQGKNVALLFKNDPLKLTIEEPLPFYQYPIQAKGLEIEVPCEAKTAGAIIYYPLSLLIAVGI